MCLRQSMFSSLPLLLLASHSGFALSQGTANSENSNDVGFVTTSNSPTWLRDIKVSPNGEQIAFTYSGQIWVVPALGGEAIALTSSDTYSQHPTWSPDSQSIAFTADRFGPGDVFVVPSIGGQATRLTYHYAKDIPYSFSPDGQDVYFSSRRLGSSEANFNAGLGGNDASQIYSVSVVGGREKLILPTQARDIAFNTSGSQFLYTNTPSYEQNWRKRAVSDATRDIWLFDTQSKKHTALTDFRGEDRNAVWAQDEASFYYLSERSGSFNIWQKNINGNTEPKQISHHKKLPVRFLSQSNTGDLVYGFDGQIWRQSSGAEKAQKVSISIRQINLSSGQYFVNLNDQASEIVISPTSPEAAIIARGDVYIVSGLSGNTKRVTNTPQQEKNVSFSNDGYRVIYSSERNGHWDVFQTYVNDTAKSFSTSLDLKEEQLSDEGADEIQPLFSPNGKRVAYREDRNSIKVYDLENDETYELLSNQQVYSYSDEDLTYSWSPDSQYLVTRNRASFNSDIVILSADNSQEPINVSNSGFSDTQPKFSADGQIVYWLSNKNALRTIDESAVQADIYAVYLNRKAQHQALKTKEQKWLDEEIAADKDEPDHDTTPEPTVIDQNGLKYRTQRITPYSLQPLFFQLTADNKNMIVAHYVGDVIEFTEVDIETGETYTLFTRSASDINAITMTPDDELLVVIGTQGIERLTIASGESDFVDYEANAYYDFSREIEYIFDHVWRLTESKFYDTEMHGVDWSAYGERYKKQLRGIHNYTDFAELLSEMVGELNASHTGASYRTEYATWEEPASLGLYYDDHYRAKGVRIKSILPGGPADTFNSPLKTGSIIYAVNGKEVSEKQDIYSALNFTQGKLTQLTVLAPGETLPVQFKLLPISLGLEGQLAYDVWVDQRKAITENLSDGKIGYLHLQSMDSDGFTQMQNDLFGDLKDKQAVIVDVRFNGGGFLHDQVMSILSGVRHSKMETRDGYEVSSFPERRWAKPSLMIANASSYSDASIVPYFYQKEGVGLLVGERVPGTGTAVIWESQQEPNLTYGVPQLGFKDDQGNWFENKEIVPDLLVYNDPNSIAKGEDKQLQASIKLLLSEIDKR